MFGIDGTFIAFALLAGLSAGAVSYALLQRRIEDESNTTRRMDQIKATESDRSAVKTERAKAVEANKRRKSVQDTLKELEQKEKTRAKQVKKPPFKIQIRQAGMTTPIGRFYIYSSIVAVVLSLVSIFLGAPVWLAPGVFFVTLFGLPRWFVGFVRARRVKKFLDEFPNALDIIVRAVKSGLPLNDGIRLIANESLEPVKAEFRRIVESQQVGLSIPEAALRMPETMPCSEAAFFGIVIQIQQQAGGNLSEALGNLSRVLRDRKKMKARVDALSMEAKASAAIIGALPFLVATLVSLASPTYIYPLFYTSTGHFLLGISAVWMTMGILVMRKMINFDM
ncbi:MAG: type II secretion system F family protein [Phyllobacteriaceae bacterium]|nr:type II secretion system F family protein [Phyllobacteriaceae bacterium]